jgi:Lrp/AsnC family leucine-responsive transcriptional regulator
MFVTLERPHHREAFLTAVQQQAEVQECHHITGDDDYLLKVRCKNTAHLDWLLNERLKRIDGVLRTRTMIALSSAKETATLPLPTDIEFKE